MVLTASFHFIVWTSSSCTRWASLPLALIFFGSSVWYLKETRRVRRGKNLAVFWVF